MRKITSQHKSSSRGRVKRRQEPFAEEAVIVGKDRDLRTVNTHLIICFLLPRAIQNSYVSSLGRSRLCQMSDK